MLKYFTAQHRIKKLRFNRDAFPVIKNINLLVIMGMSFIFKVNTHIFIRMDVRAVRL